MPAMIDKLHKLIAHERSARAVGSTQEAEAFAARIATMLTEHKLSMTEIEFRAQDATDPIAESRLEGLPRRIEQWLHVLATAIAQSLYCRVMFKEKDDEDRTTGLVLIWVGRNSDRAAAVEMFRYLSALGEGFARKRIHEMQSTPVVVRLRRGAADDQKLKTYVERTIRTKFAKWKKDFLFAYSSALHQRLTENRKSLEAASTTTGLILRDQLAIDSYVWDSFVVKPGKGRAVKTTFDGALQEGWKAGTDVSIKARAGLTSGS